MVFLVVYDSNGRLGEDINAKRCPPCRLTNLQDSKFDFRFTTIASLRRSKHSANERPNVTIALSDDGLRIGAIRMGCPQSGAICTTLSARPLAWARRQFATVLKTYRASRGLSCVKKYSCITVLKRTYRHWRAFTG